MNIEFSHCWPPSRQLYLQYYLARPARPPRRNTKQVFSSEVRWWVQYFHCLKCSAVRMDWSVCYGLQSLCCEVMCMAWMNCDSANLRHVIFKSGHLMLRLDFIQKLYLVSCLPVDAASRLHPKLHLVSCLPVTHARFRECHRIFWVYRTNNKFSSSRTNNKSLAP